MARFIWGVLFGILLLAGGLALVVSLGGINMAATEEPGTLETSVAGWTVERSVAARAPQGSNPFADDPEAIDAGLAHYRATCVHCHGAPQVEASEFAAGLNPPAPELSLVAKEWTDGELFWIAKHGLRMTGMPAFGNTHSDEDLWKVAAFVRKLDDLTEEQVAALSQGTPADRLAEARGHDDHEHGEGDVADKSATGERDSTKLR
jgi:mono/diheme cytochrome c family protein